MGVGGGRGGADELVPNSEDGHSRTQVGCWGKGGGLSHIGLLGPVLCLGGIPGLGTCFPASDPLPKTLTRVVTLCQVGGHPHCLSWQAPYSVDSQPVLAP